MESFYSGFLIIRSMSFRFVYAWKLYIYTQSQWLNVCTVYAKSSDKRDRDGWRGREFCTRLRFLYKWEVWKMTDMYIILYMMYQNKNFYLMVCCYDCWLRPIICSLFLSSCLLSCGYLTLGSCFYSILKSISRILNGSEFVK